MSALPFTPDAPRAPRPIAVALLASVFVVAACGLLYELAAGALASYLLGDSVLQFSTVIGTYLFAMGVGSWLSRYFERSCRRTSCASSCWWPCWAARCRPCCSWPTPRCRGVPAAAVRHGAGGGHAGGAGDSAGHAHPAAQRALKDLVSQVLTFDYLGALAVSLAFPLLLVPQLGLIRTGFCSA
jgi:spermidine synthase